VTEKEKQEQQKKGRKPEPNHAYRRKEKLRRRRLNLKKLRKAGRLVGMSCPRCQLPFLGKGIFRCQCKTRDIEHAPQISQEAG